MDITKNEVKENAKIRTLEIIQKTMEQQGLDMKDYNISLFKKTTVKAAPNIQLFQTAAYIAATCLTPSANKILMYFLSLAEFENFITMDQKSLNEELKISLRSAEYGIKELVDNGILIKIKHPSDKRRNDYFLNPMQAWKGKTLNRKIALAKMNQESSIQLQIFGESFEDSQIRESNEIKAKKPSYEISSEFFKQLRENVQEDYDDEEE